ncbi:MAG TPA: peptidoglycan editing factor PgeF [Aestuariivirgaceae bacterium]|nr:peptidoglycan editing factor PgeF [Aestuariivirgaceae bacterium]
MIEAPLLKDIPGIAHGFFTRQGGSSEGLYRSLNCGYGSGDDLSVVARNRAVVAGRLGIDTDSLVSVYQVHSPVVVNVVAPWKPGEAPRADAMVTRTPGIGIGALSADCAPVVFVAGDGRAVGVAHAGWKGALDGVTDATIAALENLGAVRSDIRAAVGPTISARSYEVGPEFEARFLAADAANASYFAGGPAGRPMFDLPGYVVGRLRRAGIAAVANLDHCTYADEERFFSYRRATHRSEPVYGRLMSAVAITA